MEKPGSWIPHVEAFVDSSRLSNQQVASVGAIAALVKNGQLTLEALITPTLVDALSISCLDNLNKDVAYSLLLVLSGLLMDDNGKETILENIHIIVNCLIKLVSYPHLMVLRAVSAALDDRKRAVRQEAVRCRQA